MDRSSDVIIVGGGPVGLFLAGELALRGVKVTVLERDKELAQWKSQGLGFRGLNVSSAEALYRRDMLDAMFGDGKRPDALSNFGKGARPDIIQKTTGTRFAGHFAGIMLDSNKIDYSRWKYHLHGPSRFSGPTFLGHIEKVYGNRAEKLGARILRGKLVNRIEDEGQQVKVWAGDEVFEARWVVGCDGGRSTVRKAAGIEFLGTEPIFTAYGAICEFDRPELLKPGFNTTETGFYIKPGPDQLYVFEFDTAYERSQPVDKAHFQKVVQKVSGTDLVVKEFHQGFSTTDRTRQAAQYRNGRLFLAGDTAHIQSPMGAQGLNAGMGDAMNLGWKLAAAIKGTAPPDLLDTYHNERYPIAERVLEWSRAQTAMIRPDPQSRALAGIVRKVINTQDGTHLFLEQVLGLAQRYDLGANHELVGCSAPDLEFKGGQRLGEKLRHGGFLLVDFESDPSLAEFIKQLGPEVLYTDDKATKTFGLKAMLVRPDGVVAWAPTEDVTTDDLRSVLSRWYKLCQ